ncbi:hypothetical protein ACYSNR_01065 [Enterococcus sp. LJL128]
MECFTCFDNKVIWVEDKYGRSTCGPCPICNLNGNEVRKEIEKMEKKQKVKEDYASGSYRNYHSW